MGNVTWRLVWGDVTAKTGQEDWLETWQAANGVVVHSQYEGTRAWVGIAIAASPNATEDNPAPVPALEYGAFPMSNDWEVFSLYLDVEGASDNRALNAGLLDASFRRAKTRWEMLRTYVRETCGYEIGPGRLMWTWDYD
jgi:hypothetical protein